MRIITGCAKGTRLQAPKGMSTRPTADRVKESLFSILGENIFDKNVLDIFAGTGSLGLEALSRGAKKAFFIDVATKNVILKNIRSTHLETRACVLGMDFRRALHYLQAQGESFDVVFADPPYNFPMWDVVFNYLGKDNFLHKDAYVIFELGRNEDLILKNDFLEEVRSISYGKTTKISIFRHI